MRAVEVFCDRTKLKPSWPRRRPSALRFLTRPLTAWSLTFPCRTPPVYSLLETFERECVFLSACHRVHGPRSIRREEQRLRRYSKSIIIKGAKLARAGFSMKSACSSIKSFPTFQTNNKMILRARNRDALLEGRRILVVEDDVRNVYSLTSILEPRGARVQIARNGREALKAIEKSFGEEGNAIDLVLMDVMMPIMDGLTATHQLGRTPTGKSCRSSCSRRKPCPMIRSGVLRLERTIICAKPSMSRNSFL